MILLLWLLSLTVLLAAPSELTVMAPANDDGRHLQLGWKPDNSGHQQYILSSHSGATGPWKLVKKNLAATSNSFYDTVDPQKQRYWYRISTLPPEVNMPAKLADPAAFFQQHGSLSAVAQGEPQGCLLYTSDAADE